MSFIKNEGIEGLASSNAIFMYTTVYSFISSHYRNMPSNLICPK